LAGGGHELVVSNQFPYAEVQFTVRGFEMRNFAYLDTGFDGFLIVSDGLVSTLGQRDLVSAWELGDGSLTNGADYLGEIEISGLAPPIVGQITCLGNEWMIGLGLLNHFRVVFDHGRKVEIHT
jgi:predicted aspartyl protease